jgi:hypothetical protein
MLWRQRVAPPPTGTANFRMRSVARGDNRPDINGLISGDPRAGVYAVANFLHQRSAMLSCISGVEPTQHTCPG